MVHWREFLDPCAPQGGYLPWKEVSRRTSLSRTTAWRLQKQDDFPSPYPISPGRVGHLEREVDAWIASRAIRRDASVAAPGPASERAVKTRRTTKPLPALSPRLQDVQRVVGRGSAPAPRHAPRRREPGKPDTSQQMRFEF
jgi:prophage regulatory protein